MYRTHHFFFILFFKLTFAIQIQTISNIQIPILLQFDCFVNGNAIKMSFFDFDLINLLKSYIISNSTGHPRVWVIVLVVVAESSSLRKTRNRCVRSTDLGTYVKKSYKIVQKHLRRLDVFHQRNQRNNYIQVVEIRYTSSVFKKMY